MSVQKIQSLLQDMVGEDITLPNPDYSVMNISDENFDVGYSQLNEVLLLHGFDRITKEFFQYLVDQTTEYKPKSRITSIDQLEKGINEFRKISILWWGNIKKGFKTFARDSSEYFLFVLNSIKAIEPDTFKFRHKPIILIKEILPRDSYLLGHIVKKELDAKQKTDPENPELIALLAKREKVVGIGIQNLKSYLASDHLDVYVATSMRHKHEYVFVSKTIKKIFNNHHVQDLNLRYFDPTQAYCESRIDKGLSEGLMLKRAKCTVYLAQESDTLGKDSELASTLAQGKAVIAFVPEVSKEYVHNLISELMENYPDQDEETIILNQLEVFKPSLAWGRDIDSIKVKLWIESPKARNLTEMRDFLISTIESHYDKRASTLRHDHPLGLQVNLDTGVATGVLVVRSVEDCAKLIKAIVLKRIIFNLQRGTEAHNEKDIYLTESISGCIFRVTSGDKFLTNAFWNFYLESDQL